MDTLKRDATGRAPRSLPREYFDTIPTVG
ncbi:protein of unknown function [Candidatus Nitrospira inopinata]|uniref:Uncharacterized protein n=1 Tax=Candidatus Nitrospira inopinata TaxID=1715989 RepID=A0A0S4KTH4_9BACT|nr:protein of unknown function [Candidatus Nitrospira inopinata]